MEEKDFLQSQIIQLNNLLNMCQHHPFMKSSLLEKIKEFEDRLSKWKQDHTTEK